MKKKYGILIIAAVALATACASYETENGEVTEKPTVSDAPEAPAAASGETAAPAIGAAGGAAEAPAPGSGAPTPGGGVRGASSGAAKDELEFLVEEPADDEGFSDSGFSDSGFSTKEAAAAPSVAAGRGGAPAASGLKAGFADDNRQYGYFLDFLDEYAAVPHYDLGVRERIMLRVVDSQGKPVANARVTVLFSGRAIAEGLTMADGTYQFNPSTDTPAGARYRATVTAGNETAAVEFDRGGLRNVAVELSGKRTVPDPVPLDILFILDTTGSMGEEIHRLRATIELIHLNLTSMSTKTEVRFGMVLYKDTGDEYNTLVVPLTDDIGQFSSSLDLVEASGGGDIPENLQAALESSLRDVDWNTGGIRLGFIITDAPPHLDYNQTYEYGDAAAEAKKRAIKFFSVGTGGLPLSGEYVLRQIAQYTGGKYIFLTYGETDESEGGAEGSVSHHTGANYQTDKLEAIIIRFAKEELSYLTGERFDEEEPYFQAVKIASEEREETLLKLFTMAVEELSDYSTYPVKGAVGAAILPIEPATAELELDAEYFTEQMLLAVREGGLTVVDRANIENVMNELKLQLSGITDSQTVAEIGKLLNAQVLIAGKLYMPGTYELFLRLLRVETGEVLSVTKARIDATLGLRGR